MPHVALRCQIRSPYAAGFGSTWVLRCQIGSPYAAGFGLGCAGLGGVVLGWIGRSQYLSF